MLRKWWVRPWLPRWFIPLALGWVLALQPALTALHAPPAVIGPLDWSAHLATAALVLANLPFRLPAETVAATLLAVVAIDLDHVPHHLGSDFLSAGAPRPYTHSVAPVIAALAIAALLRRRVHRSAALGVALGLAAHLARDVATAGGIPLLWPVTTAGAGIPFWLYAAALAALALRAWLLAPRLPFMRTSESPPRGR